jgi:hypothetical protein
VVPLPSSSPRDAELSAVLALVESPRAKAGRRHASSITYKIVSVLIHILSFLILILMMQSSWVLDVAAISGASQPGPFLIRKGTNDRMLLTPLNPWHVSSSHPIHMFPLSFHTVVVCNVPQHASAVPHLLQTRILACVSPGSPHFTDASHQMHRCISYAQYHCLCAFRGVLHKIRSRLTDAKRKTPCCPTIMLER